jgi:HSP20 family molecular chaperone IbpA
MISELFNRQPDTYIDHRHLNTLAVMPVVYYMNKNLLSLLTLFVAAVLLTMVSAQGSPTPSPTASAVASNSSTPTLSPSAATPSIAGSPGPWDPLADMQRMQTEMNQFFSRAMNEFGMNPNFLTSRNEPGYSSSIDVRDKGDHYEVHAFLPGRDISNVKVTAESNNLLRVTASKAKQEKKTTQLGESLVAEFGEYEQLVTLPGPANTKDMTIDRKEHELVITIPKKKA